VKLYPLLKFSVFGLSTILFKRKKALLGTIILTDRCNLSCKHCAVHSQTAAIYPYEQIQQEMQLLYQMGIRILFFCGGETFLWQDNGKSLRDLVKEAKQMGFLIVNVVTNGTFPIDLPEADLILLSLDGERENHNQIRGNTYDTILENIRAATADNICLYMAINNINKQDIRHVCEVARMESNVRSVSFNFHTPFPGTEDLSLSVVEKEEACNTILDLINQRYPIFNLRSTFPSLINNSFKTPCHQCVVMEKGKLFVCGRCIDVPGLCEQCGFFFVAEFALIFGGNIRAIIDTLRTYLKYI